MKRISVIIVLFVVGMCLLDSCKYTEKKNINNTITICAEESMKIVIEEMTNYFNKIKGNKINFEITYLPMDTENRRSICKQLQLELMTGKGKDVYLLSEFQKQIKNSVSDENIMLLADGNKALYNGIFLDLSEFTNKDNSFQSCFSTIMKSGSVNEHQYIVPFTFDFTIIKREKNKNEKFSLEDSTVPFLELLVDGKLSDIDTREWLYYIKEWIGNSFDYQEGKIYFTKEDIKKILRYSILHAKKDEPIQSKCKIVSAKNENLRTTTFGDNESLEYMYWPMPTLNGKPNAIIYTYGAIGRNCKNPKLCYDFLRLFWQKEFASGEGFAIENKGYLSHYMTGSIYELRGIPVQEEVWKAWYMTKLGTTSCSDIGEKNAQNFEKAVQQISTSRFYCTVDEIGDEIRAIFYDNGFEKITEKGIEDDIDLASEKIYNSIRYIVME